MQLMPITGEYIARKHGIDWKGSDLLQDPVHNLRLGTAYLKHLLVMFKGDYHKVFAAYNWGPGNLNSALRERREINSAVKQYADNIIATAAEWRRECHKG
jgi:soluble lytic murein transglycosylase